MRLSERTIGWACVLAITLCSLSARAQNNVGYQLNHYEDTPAGDTFLAVEHPWYSGTRYFAGGLTLDYAHNVLGTASYQNGQFKQQSVVTSNQLQGHIDLAASMFDRVALSFELPVVVGEGGQPVNVETGSGIKSVGPSSAGVGDPRLGLRVRLFGDTDKDALAMSAGAYVWIPIGANDRFQGDASVRVMPRVTLGGVAKDHLRYSLNAGFLYRHLAQLVPGASTAAGNTVGSEVQLGLAVHAMFLDHALSFGPEALVDVAVGSRPSQQSAPYAELLGSINYLIARTVMVQAGIGGGLSGVPGPPEARGILRITYAPVRDATPPDRDGDGIVDAQDQCPEVPVGLRSDANHQGCPAKDADGDGVYDDEDECPTVPQGAQPDPKHKGCALKDTDSDGVYDSEDECPTVPQGAQPDPKHKGCPRKDADGDGVDDDEDECPTVPQGAQADPKHKGCSQKDTDSDGVYDDEDECPTVPQGAQPDPKHKGCPRKDADGDGVYDDQDECPSVPQGAHPDLKRPGCPTNDIDSDGVVDNEDLCPTVPAGLRPDPERKGCPQPDSDGDSVSDPVDACPDKPGAPSPDPKKNGCPGLVVVAQAEIKILQQVFFDTAKATIQKRSDPLLDAVVYTLQSMPAIKRMSVEGHTDNQGSDKKNLKLSQGRADAVVRYLVSHGIDASRLEAHGYGASRPITTNKTAAGRQTNRRVQFTILDPAPSSAQ